MKSHIKGKNQSESKISKKAGSAENFPAYCDYSCRYADFGPTDSIGGCRKEISVWCSLEKKFNNKNNKCIAGSVKRKSVI